MPFLEEQIYQKVKITDFYRYNTKLNLVNVRKHNVKKSTVNVIMRVLDVVQDVDV